MNRFLLHMLSSNQSFGHTVHTNISPLSGISDIPRCDYGSSFSPCSTHRLFSPCVHWGLTHTPFKQKVSPLSASSDVSGDLTYTENLVHNTYTQKAPPLSVPTGGRSAMTCGESLAHTPCTQKVSPLCVSLGGT